MKFQIKAAIISLLLSAPFVGMAQYPGWQQEANYDIDIVMNVENHTYEGELSVMYTNNSPDDLNKVFWHAFFNAFQPGSMMDVRSRNIADPDSRVGDRIFHLPEEEWGKIEPISMTMNGLPCRFEVDGTIIVAQLPAALRPGVTCEFTMKWNAQVPRQIRRSGWMNKEGVEFSMTQWFPKLCEYDHMGWHSNPYIGREFHGIWGDYDVNITLPKGYEVAASGVLQTTRKEARKSGQWHFIAENVIDFAWAADQDFVVITDEVDGIEMNFIFQNEKDIKGNWKELPRFAKEAMHFFNEYVGKYPYPQYTIVQGGDGGMEYPMITLITGGRSLPSLVGVTVHEMAHSWFQALVATNESLYEWMDEGFTSYIETECMEILPGLSEAKAEEGVVLGDIHNAAYSVYISNALSGNEEPLITHADHYSTNRAYGINAYYKGEVIIKQLEAILGAETRDEALKQYFSDWSFKHPGPNDFMRTMEKVSDIELDWYFQYFVNTTHTIDYGIKTVEKRQGSTKVVLERVGAMPMPQDVMVVFEDGTEFFYHIPLVIMRGNRDLASNETLAQDWPWTHPTYELTIPTLGKRVAKVVLDPKRLQADVNYENNVFE